MKKEEINAQLVILRKMHAEVEQEHKIVAEFAHLYTSQDYHYEDHQVVYQSLGQMVYMLMRLRKQIILLERELETL